MTAQALEDGRTKMNVMQAYSISKYRKHLMGVAALSIFLMHAIGRGYLHIFLPLDQLLMKIGSTGVDIFLFLSGLGVYCSLSKVLADRRARYPLPWLGRKLVNVYLSYCLILLVFIWLIPCDGLLQGLAKFLTLDFWIHGNDGTWFVSFILLLYLLSPLVFQSFAHLDSPKAGRVFLLELLSCYLLLFVFERVFPVYSKQVGSAVFQIPQFLIGQWLGYLFKNGRRIPLWYVVLGAAAGLADLILRYPSNSFVSHSLETCFSFVTMLCYIWLFELLTRLVRKPVTSRLLTAFWDTVCSTTLEFYLIHLLLMVVWSRYALPGGVNVVPVFIFLLTFFGSYLVNTAKGRLVKAIYSKR